MSRDHATPAEESPRKWRWWKPELFYFAIPLLAFGIIWFGIRYPLYINKTNKQNADYIQAVNNAKQIHMLLVDFEQDYGRLPDATTAPLVEETAGIKADMAGNSSNSLLRQLIIGGFVQSEDIFFTKGKSTKKPDNVVMGNNALDPGECGFAYITGQSTKAKPGTPLLAAPTIPGTTQFDPTIFNGKAVILRIGSDSPKKLTIAEDGHVYEKGKDIFDSAQPWWDGKKPVIAYPE